MNRAVTSTWRKPAPVAALVMGAAGMGGCAHGLLESAGEFEDFASDYEAVEQGLSPRSRPDTFVPASPTVLGAFHDRLAARAVARGHEARPSALNDHLLMAGQPEAYALTANPDGGPLGAEIQRETARDVGDEFRKICRRALIEAVRQQGFYRALRDLVALDTDEPAPFGRASGGVRGAGADRDGDPYAWMVNEPWLAAPNPTDVSGSLSVGVRPKLGIKWMRAYQLKWDAREQELTHRLEYPIGPFGTAAEYRLERGKPTRAGVGLYKPLGPMTLLSLSAARGLRDEEPDDDRSYYAELYCRF